MEYLGPAFILMLAISIALFIVSRGKIFQESDFFLTTAISYAFIIGFTIGVQAWLVKFSSGPMYIMIKYGTPILGGLAFLTTTCYCFKRAIHLRRRTK